MAIVKVNITENTILTQSPDLYKVTVNQAVRKQVNAKGIFPAGAASSNLGQFFTAGQNLSSGRIVSMIDDVIVYFDPTDEGFAGNVLGIAKTAALEGDDVSVVTDGIFELVGLGLTPGLKYYAGPNGSVISNPSGLKVVQSIGTALTSNKLKISISSPIITN
jgi:hypothetical protein